MEEYIKYCVRLQFYESICETEKLVLVWAKNVPKFIKLVMM